MLNNYNFLIGVFMSELQTVINLVEKDGEYFVSSNEVADRFGKRHRDVRRNISELQVSDNFKEHNFSRYVETNTNGVSRYVYYMSKDGFMMLAMGFTGKEATKWKENFIVAFNKMADVIKKGVPILEARIKQLESEKNTLLLGDVKKPHHLKNTVLVPVSVNTLFGPEIEYRRVKKNNINYSALSYIEGELKRLASCMSGMAKKIDTLTKESALMRRN